MSVHVFKPDYADHGLLTSSSGFFLFCFYPTEIANFLIVKT